MQTKNDWEGTMMAQYNGVVNQQTINKFKETIAPMIFGRNSFEVKAKDHKDTQ